MIQTPTFIIVETPIKTAGAELIAPELLEKQAQQAVICLTAVDYRTSRGTCIDERPREETDPRLSVPGGPDVYALAVNELIGTFEDSDMPAEERLRSTKKTINNGGILSGGHFICAANGVFATWIPAIGKHPDAMLAYAQSQMGDRYHPDAAHRVIENAIRFEDSHTYKGWNEQVLVNVLGSEAAEAIEKLRDVPHEGVTLVRNKIEGMTVDQNELYDRSVIGKGSFVFDDPYADKIEHVLASGPDAAEKKLLAEHAREMILAAVAGAVPNPELYQIDLN
ncbi:MAG TPA: hypothetical protein VHB72_03930 [Candidatus Saccharimonadales bacterium]|nr:hypothetical protein [Candidatus Saccharimonadales bacterium]